MITKTCTASGQKFIVTDEDLAFYEKMGVPSPTLCPDERLRRRTAWRNERNLFNQICAATGKSLISSFDETVKFPIYERNYWWSDKWDPKDYGREFDFSRPFFEQFSELQAVVPQLPIINDDGVGSDNCAYCYDLLFSKDCYLAVGMWEARDCYYTTLCDYGVDLVDCEAVYKSELSYECLYSRNLYECAFLECCINCSDCWFGFDLIGCKHCYCCTGLRQKEYYIFNKPYSREEYERIVEGLNTGSLKNLKELKNKWADFFTDKPRQAVQQIQCEACTGDMLYNSKNCLECHRLYNGEHCKFYVRGDSPKYCYDIFSSGNGEWCYEGVTPDNSWMTAFVTWCWKCKQVWYSDNCHSCDDLFGCIGMKKAKYCILNKQYSKEEYFELRAKIVAHMKETGGWGEFFPIELSPYAYNDSVAFGYFPEDQDVCESGKWKWRKKKDNERVEIQDDLMDDIVGVEDEILGNALICRESGKSYRLQKNELRFYRKMKLPIPRLHPVVRREKRLEKRHSYRLWGRDCSECGNQIQSVYQKDRSEKVLCEDCYQTHIQ